MKPRSHFLLDRSNTVILMSDLQEPFLRNIHQREQLIERSLLLVRAAAILGVPVVYTMQYSEKMGPVIPELRPDVSAHSLKPIEKLTFSAAADQSFTDTLTNLRREQIVICGVETHICVTQTALDLLHLDYQVHVAADAVSSRTNEQHKLGMEKMRDCGVLPCAVEGAVMELLYRAGSDEFKSILRLIK